MTYYFASPDYDDIDTNANAALCQILEAGSGFPNLAVQMAYRGFTFDQLKIRSGLITLGNDAEGIDWGLNGSIHWWRSYGNPVILEIAGEPILEYLIDTNYNNWYLDDPDLSWSSYSSYSLVENISGSASPDAQFVALSLLKDIGDQYAGTYMEGHGVSNYSDEYGRAGSIHQVDNGYLTLGWQDTLVNGVIKNDLEMELLKVKPNPFRNTIQMTFELPNPEHILLEVYNALGARIETLEKGFFAEGTHQITWNAGGMVDGLYFCRLQTGNKVFTQKLIKLEK